MKKLAKLFAGLMAAAFIFASCSNPIEPPANTISRDTESVVAANQQNEKIKFVLYTNNGLEDQIKANGGYLDYDANVHPKFVFKNVTIKYQIDGGKVKEKKVGKLEMDVNHPWINNAADATKMAGWQAIVELDVKLEEGQVIAIEIYGDISDAVAKGLDLEVEPLKADLVDQGGSNGWAWTVLASKLPVKFLEPEAAPPSGGTGTKVTLDLSGATPKDGQTITAAADKITAKDVSWFAIPIGQEIPAETEVKCTVKGTNNGNSGFRCYFVKGISDSNKSNIWQDKLDLSTGPFDLSFDLTPTEAVDTLCIKGINYSTNIEDIEITSVELSWGGDDEEETKKEVEIVGTTSYWDQVEITKEDLLGNVAPADVEKIVFSADGKYGVAYNSTKVIDSTAKNPNWSQTADLTASYEADDIDFSGYYLTVIAQGGTGTTTKITWKVVTKTSAPPAGDSYTEITGASLSWGLAQCFLGNTGGWGADDIAENQSMSNIEHCEPDSSYCDGYDLSSLTFKKKPVCLSIQKSSDNEKPYDKIEVKKIWFVNGANEFVVDLANKTVVNENAASVAQYSALLLSIDLDIPDAEWDKVRDGKLYVTAKFYTKD